MNHKQHKGLGIPEGYFSDLEKAVLAEVETFETEKLLKAKFYKGYGLETPADYFESIGEENYKQTRVVQLKRIIYPIISAAAVALIVLSIVPLLNSGDAPLASNSSEELLAKMNLTDDENLELLEWEDLAEIYASNEEFTTEILTSSDEAIDFLIEDEDMLEALTEDLYDI